MVGVVIIIIIIIIIASRVGRLGTQASAILLCLKPSVSGLTKVSFCGVVLEAGSPWITRKAAVSLLSCSQLCIHGLRPNLERVGGVRFREDVKIRVY